MKNIFFTLITSTLICFFMSASTAFASDDPRIGKYDNHHAKLARQAAIPEALGRYPPTPKDHEEPVYCGDILSQPGFYRMESDLECTSSIQVTSSNVFLNLGRHTLTCLPEAWEYPDDLGVPEEDRDVWVKGINVNFNNFDDPSLEPVVTNVHISNGTIENCAYGISLYKADRTTVTRMTLRNNTLDSPCCRATGLEVVESHNNKFLRNKVSDNSRGIALFASTGNALARNKVTNNLLEGITILGSDGNRLLRNESINNVYGIWLQGSNDNFLSKNIIMDSFLTGLILVGEQFGNRIVQNQVDGNGNGGIHLMGATVAGDFIGVTIPEDNLVKGNSAHGNDVFDLFEGIVDFSDFTFTEFELLEGDDCYNTWAENTYDSAFSIANCIN